jgi:hypothetical protein
MGLMENRGMIEDVLFCAPAGPAASPHRGGHTIDEAIDPSSLK